MPTDEWQWHGSSLLQALWLLKLSLSCLCSRKGYQCQHEATGRKYGTIEAASFPLIGYVKDLLWLLALSRPKDCSAHDMNS